MFFLGFQNVGGKNEAHNNISGLWGAWFPPNVIKNELWLPYIEEFPSEVKYRGVYILSFSPSSLSLSLSFIFVSLFAPVIPHSR